MALFEEYRVTIPGWATSIEVVSELPTDGSDTVRLELDDAPEFLVAVASLPNGRFAPWQDVHLAIDTDSRSYEQGRTQFTDEDRGLFIFNSPPRSSWAFTLSSRGRSPFSVNIMAFHGNPPSRPVASRLRQTPTVPSTFRCRACKTTAKALALSIVAAASLPALPQALIAAVSSYLGVASVVAAAFIGSVVGDTADMIAEKLCEFVGLC